MCIILIFSSFSISLLKTCTIPSIEYVLSIWPLRFSSCQWNAVKFSFMNILCNSSRPIDVLSIFFKPFLLPRAFLRVFYLQIVRLSFMRSFFDFPIRWQASISWLDSFTSILSKISIIFSSRFWSSASSGILVIWRLFLRPYCSKKLMFSSSEIIFFQGYLFYGRSLWFSTCKSFIIKSFKFSICLSKLSKRDNNLLLKLMISSDDTGVLLSLETNKLCLVS